MGMTGFRHPGIAPARARLLAVLAAAALAACATGPDHSPPSAEALAMPGSWSGAAAEQAPAAPDSLATWWRQLGDPTLDALVGRALAASPTLAAANARVREARAARDLARAQGLPTVGAALATSRSRAEGGDTRSFYDAGLDASWEPDLFGGQRRGVEAAQADLEAGVEDLRGARVTLASEVASSYVDVRSLQARIAIARANLAAQRETLQLTEWRTQAGLTSSLDVEQARTGVEQTRAHLPALELALAEARHRLAVLAGAAPASLDALLAEPRPLAVPPAAIALGIPADTLRQRPDLRAAERRLAAETARIGVARAQRLPSLALTGTIGLESLTLAGLTGGGALAGQLAARLAGTVFDARRTRAQVQRQEAARERTFEAYRAAVLAALEDVENALWQIARSRERREALAGAVEAAGNAALLAQQRYAAGITDFQTVLDTQRTLLAAQDNLQSTEADQVKAVIRLYKALGGGWDPATPEG